MTTLETETAPIQTTTELAIWAENLSLSANRGPVFGPIDLNIPVGGLTVFTGPAGSGKTALLLTLIGRMKPSSGSRLSVLGYPLPRGARAVQHRTSGTGFHGLDDLDEEVSVAACVRERMAWLAPWYKIITTPSDEQIARICAPVFGDHPVPRGKEIVHSLDESTNLLLRIALALMSNPEIIAIDQIDQLLDTAERDIVWRRLHALCTQGLTILTSTSGEEEPGRVLGHTRPTVIAMTRTRKEN